MSSSHSLTDVLRVSIECPRCARCRTCMMLVTMESRLDGSEKRTFECANCHFIETQNAEECCAGESRDANR